MTAPLLSLPILKSYALESLSGVELALSIHQQHAAIWVDQKLFARKIITHPRNMRGREIIKGILTRFR
jgi:hypothetical protein